MSIETWQDLNDALCAQGFDEDEYLSLSWRDWYETPDYRNLPIFDNNAHWISAYAVRGGSEGWYVHIDKIVVAGRFSGTKTCETMLLAKFWSLDRALECVNAATRLIYS